MKTVGLIGGTGWPATRDYYTLLNQLAQKRLGRLHGLDLRLWSFDFQQLLDAAEVDANAIDAAFNEAACGLRGAGAQLLAVASNTGHLFLRGVLAQGLPIVHIAEACAREMAGGGVSRAGVLATRRALAGGVFESHFALAGVQLVPPEDGVTGAVDAAIFGELERGEAGSATRDALAAACAAWHAAGVAHVLLGCTEIRPQVFSLLDLAPGVRLWDSTLMHCSAIVDAALWPS